MSVTNKKSILFNQLNLTNISALEPFIYTDILAEYAGNYQTNCFHFWSMTNQVVLGMKDTRVKDLKKGVTHIINHGYHPVVRNSGGLAVVADTGILNFSIIIPQQDGFAINEGYQLMKSIIEKALSDFNCHIDAFEVSDSYCPGDFDLSINGKKFAGISQRRIKKGIAILIYLGVSNDQTFRGELIRDFYQASLGEEFGTDGYPAVNPDSMATLSELLGTDLTVEEIHQRLLDTLKTDFQFDSLTQENFNQYLTSTEFSEKFSHQEKRMQERNDVIDWSDLPQ